MSIGIIEEAFQDPHQESKYENFFIKKNLPNYHNAQQ